MIAAEETKTPAPARLPRSILRVVGRAAACRRPVGSTVLALALCGGMAAHAQSGEKRVALLISNDSYPDADPSERGVGGDSRALAAQLGRDGFDTDISVNLDKRDMEGAINAFLAKITPKSAALFYFKGVGIQVAHQSYIIPTDALIWSDADVRHDGINLDTIVDEINKRGAAVKVIVVDAARSNPFERRFRNASAGLAGLDVPPGSLAIFSNALNKTAPEEHAPVSLFMTELVAKMGAPALGADEAFSQTRIAVSRASSGREVPWVTSSLEESFYFDKAGATAVPAPGDNARPVAASKTSAAANPTASASQGGTPRTQAPRVEAEALAVSPAPADRTRHPSSTASAVQHPTEIAMAPTAAAKLDAPAEGKPASGFSDCPQCPEMVMVPAGSFQMGSGTTPFERPVHKVTIAKPFAIGRTLVTFDQWTACADDGGCKNRPDTQGFGGDTRPVIDVSWLDAKEYAAWLSAKTGKTYRLPSEAEWEDAARAGTTTPFTWGASVGVGKANCTDCGGTGQRKTTPVKTYAPNALGLYDMAGNAAEWIEDCWNPSYRNAPKDGSAWETGTCSARVLRGGSFSSTSAYIKPTARFRYDADVRYQANGFRVARDLP